MLNVLILLADMLGLYGMLKHNSAQVGVFGALNLFNAIFVPFGATIFTWVGIAFEVVLLPLVFYFMVLLIRLDNNSYQWKGRKSSKKSSSQEGSSSRRI